MLRGRVYVCSSLPHVFLASGSALRISLVIGSLSAEMGKAAPASSVFPSFSFEPEPRPLLVMSGRSSDSGECLLDREVQQLYMDSFPPL